MEDEKKLEEQEIRKEEKAPEKKDAPVQKPEKKDAPVQKPEEAQGSSESDYAQENAQLKAKVLELTVQAAVGKIAQEIGVAPAAAPYLGRLIDLGCTSQPFSLHTVREYSLKSFLHWR